MGSGAGDSGKETLLAFAAMGSGMVRAFSSSSRQRREEGP